MFKKIIRAIKQRLTRQKRYRFRWWPGIGWG